MPDPASCPYCGSVYQDDPIPECVRHVFAGRTHWSRIMGIVADGRLVAWQCPDCGHEWAAAPEEDVVAEGRLRPFPTVGAL